MRSIDTMSGETSFAYFEFGTSAKRDIGIDGAGQCALRGYAADGNAREPVDWDGYSMIFPSSDMTSVVL